MPSQAATCATPANLSGNAVVSLTEDQLVCGKFYNLVIYAIPSYAAVCYTSACHWQVSMFVVFYMPLHLLKVMGLVVMGVLDDFLIVCVTRTRIIQIH